MRERTKEQLAKTIHAATIDALSIVENVASRLRESRNSYQVDRLQKTWDYYLTYKKAEREFIMDVPGPDASPERQKAWYQYKYPRKNRLYRFI